jgi:hypothetical protein
MKDKTKKNLERGIEAFLIPSGLTLTIVEQQREHGLFDDSIKGKIKGYVDYSICSLVDSGKFLGIVWGGGAWAYETVRDYFS